MKNYIKIFGIIALVAIIGFSMIACDDDDGGSDSIVGTWTGTYEQGDYSGTVKTVFNSDGTGTSTVTITGLGTFEESFTWKQEGTTVIITYEGEDPQTVTYTGGNTITVDGVTVKRS